MRPPLMTTQCEQASQLSVRGIMVPLDSDVAQSVDAPLNVPAVFSNLMLKIGEFPI